MGRHPRRSADPAARRRRRRLWLDAVLALAGVGVAVWRLAPTFAEAGDPAALFAGLGWDWLAVALVLAVASLAAYGELYRALLASGGQRLPRASVQAVTFIGNAVTQAMPSGGSLAGGAYSATALRRRGVDTALAVWAVAVAAALTAVTLLALAPLGLAAYGVLSVPAGVALSAGIAVACWAAWRASGRERVVDAVARGVLAVARRLPYVRRTDWPSRQAGRVNRFVRRIGHLRPAPRHWAAFGGIALATWLLDFLALAACVAAAGSAVPWAALAVGYLIVQLSIGLELTPGGTGPAEAGLLAALLSGGVAAGPAALVVVVYRALTLLVLGLLGWAVFAGVAVRRARRRRRAVSS
ncbi:uncharacterized protein (TIRG00374 family) [Prauserella shujinwangii]|uniref:Uncharacterized protein (TIRG00374 family) n=1 Tax=Prauserella shujinwangii TaxID=1453103 RepID=A0A2T0LM56_9PSEU|nr:flippase-like domain-containing protein [Prauserella shujinwangii]PRX44163.1 uncharacterized protein (TIRG00374 family) [Prauserella shujinwangii]